MNNANDTGKIGFALSIVTGTAGFCGPAIVCNSGTWSNNIDDVRSHLSRFTFLRNSTDVLTFLKFDESGCFVVQACGMLGRPGSCKSVWLYIPEKLRISAEDVEKAYRDARQVLLESKEISVLRGEAENFFRRAYQTKPDNESVPYDVAEPGTRSGKSALVSVSESIEKFIGQSRYQKCFMDYETVYLLENGSGIQPSVNGSFHKIPQSDVKKYCTLKAPTSEQSEQLKGAKILLDGVECKFPLRLERLSKHTVTARRDGFNDLTMRFTVGSLDVQDFYESVQSQLKWTKPISTELFSVVDIETGKKVTENPRIELTKDGQTYNVGNNPAAIPEENLRNVTIKVTAKGYNDLVKQDQNLLSQKQKPITLEMRKKLTINIKMFKIKDNFGHKLSDANVTVNGKNPANEPSFSDEELEKAEVKVTHRRCKDWEGTVNLSNKKPITITMDKKQAEWDIILKNEAKAHITTDQGEKNVDEYLDNPEQSPLEGYKYDSSRKALVYEEKEGGGGGKLYCLLRYWKWIIVSVVVVVLVIAIICVILLQKVLSEVTEKESPLTSQYWEKDAIEKVPLLPWPEHVRAKKVRPGLYTKVRNYEFEKLANIETVGQPEQLKDIVALAIRAQADSIVTIKRYPGEEIDVQVWKRYVESAIRYNKYLKEDIWVKDSVAKAAPKLWDDVNNYRFTNLADLAEADAIIYMPNNLDTIVKLAKRARDLGIEIESKSMKASLSSGDTLSVNDWLEKVKAKEDESQATSTSL